ncbi:MAG: flagellar protein FlaG [Spirochaetes bacterium]|nr:flagellar protein FlaG [Spirochaetota bacterium]
MQINGINASTDHMIKDKNIDTIREQATPKGNIDQAKLESAKTVPKEAGSGEKPVAKQEVFDALEKMGKTIEFFNKRLKFSIDENSKRIVVKVIDSETDKVVREIPPEEVLRFVANLHKFLGIFVDKKS